MPRRYCGISLHALPCMARQKQSTCAITLFAMLQTGPGDDEYGGEKPFSEPESRIVRLVAEGVHARSFVNLHAGEWAVYIPWDSQPSAAPGLPVIHPEGFLSHSCLYRPMLGPPWQLAVWRATCVSMRPEVF